MKADDSKRRKALLTAAARLFRDVGYPRATVRDIAKAVGIQSGSIFYYFETKEDLILADTRGHGDAVLAAFAERPVDEPVLSSLRAAVHSLVSNVQADRARFQRRTRIVADSPTLSSRSLERQIEWEDGLARAILPRFPDRDDAEARASVIAAATLAVVRIATRRWVAAEDSSSLEDHLLPAFDVLADELKGAD